MKKSHYRKLLGFGLAVAYAAVLPLCHADTYVWTGGSGNWSDPAKWTGGAENTYPGHSENDYAKIPANTEPITITVDVATVVTQLQFTADSSAVSKPVTLVGDGGLKLTADVPTYSGASLALGTGRQCILKSSIDCRRVYVESGEACLSIEEGGSLDHRSSITVLGRLMANGGSIVSSGSSCATTVKAGGRFVQDGGYVYTRLNIEDGGFFVLNGGTFHNRFRDETTIKDGAVFALNGGTFRQSGAWTTNCIDWASRLYPVKKDSVLDIQYYSAGGNNKIHTKYINPFGQDNCDYVNTDQESAPAFTNDYPFAGTLMCTNSTSDGSYPRFFLNSAKAAIGRPGGVLICNGIGISNETSEVDFRLSKIVLKYGFSIYNNGAQINFPNGIEFGAFGKGWNMSAMDMTIDNPASVNLYGDCVINTTDYLDGITGREIRLFNLFIGRNRTSLVAKGVGSVYFNIGTPKDDYDSFRRVEVQENATLELGRNSYINNTRVITANELVLGKNATLKINAARGRIDAVRTRIDPTSRIHVTVYNSQSAVRKLLVASLGMAEGEIDESNFVIDNQGTVEWRLVRSGNTFYLTDGSQAKPPPAPVEGRSRWIGAEGDCWSNPNNWDNGISGAEWNEKSVYADFYDSSNWHVINDIEGLKVRLLYFYKGDAKNSVGDCGPYILSGKGITIRVGNSVYNTGVLGFPIVINNPLTADSYFNASSSYDNSVSLAGGVSVSGNYLSLNGDWRLGGVVTTPAFVPGSRSNEDARPDKFTILADAKVTVSDQGTRTNNYAAAFCYNIEETGLLEFTGGTSLDFPPSFDDAYHTVYGTLDVGIPLKLGADQHFHGTGSVKVRSVADFADAKARVHLSGGVTLKPAAWSTATAADGVTAITVDGAATIRPTADLTYGTSSDGVTSTAADRALEITDAGDLTLAADEGRTVTFADPISGEGKLTICGPGTVSLSGGVSVGELVFSGSPKIVVGSENPIEVASAVSLDGVEISVPSASSSAGWTTVVVAPEIYGLPTVPSNIKATLATADGRMELRVMVRRGLLISIQ